MIKNYKKFLYINGKLPSNLKNSFNVLTKIQKLSEFSVTLMQNSDSKINSIDSDFSDLLLNAL